MDANIVSALKIWKLIYWKAFFFTIQVCAWLPFTYMV